MKVVVFSIGCKVNQYECDALVAQLIRKGYSVSEKLEFADVYILNTCAVTAEAERKSRQGVTRILNINPDAKIVVCGCASQNNTEQFSLREQVFYVGGTANKMAICDVVDKIVKENFSDTKTEKENQTKTKKANCDNIDTNRVDVREIGKDFEDMGVSKSPRTRYYVKVQDGCNNFCSYCLIPYLRGRNRSRSIESIKREIEFASQKTKEIVLTGINLSAYGKDMNSSLAELLTELKDFDVRVRLGSLEVGVISDELLSATKSLPHFCDHFHLSLQSGDDGVLKDMNRRYTTAEFFNAVELVRKYYKDVAITTDVIVGYPTEDENAFNNTLNFVKKVGFSDVHIFSYSPRKRTAAYKLKVLDSKIISRRHKELETIKLELRDSYNSNFLNVPLEVLFEKKQNGFFVGHTKNYITVYGEVAKRGEIMTTICTQLFKDGIK